MSIQIHHFFCQNSFVCFPSRFSFPLDCRYEPLNRRNTQAVIASLYHKNLDVIQPIGNLSNAHPTTTLVLRIAYKACRHLATKKSRPQWLSLPTLYKHRSQHGPLLTVWSARLELCRKKSITRFGKDRPKSIRDKERQLIL